MEQIVDNLVYELKRGTQVVLVLSQLFEPQYGYLLLEKLVKQGVVIEAGTLYPLLRRLEQQKLLTSFWDNSDVRPRKYYQMSALGDVVFKRLLKEWKTIEEQMGRVLFGGMK